MIDDNQMKRERASRRRTVVIAVIASGIVSLFVGSVSERQSYNDKVPNFRTNCKATQDVSKTLVEVARSVSESSDKNDVKVRWNGYKKKFEKSLPPQALPCAKVHPYRSPLPIVGD